mmetsp:Transcript_64175/g.144753  ORF Transcript_64175/g.144753 Transcript_64175/m.144753 type:complete len:416 (-) Transcript_64175:201-1448(-)|eukprot:CAMPEP_0172586552 /NCGR_PEP_ID=MMETSP1068-20121228/5917_1 /TAXON_ID=35684 /ORGANISM="Pseudopedinella elastica, Strain CCMP716" /LENGTH=415 /DNA_ID=CAMNT_0013381403 /DNA_START=42 /DNA_END=1289 /DNA_ORIENTATION=-
MNLFRFLVLLLPTVARGHGDHEKENLEKWNVHAPLPYSVSDQSANTIGDKIYLVGGCTGHQVGYTCPSISNKVAIYDPKTDTYDITTAPPTPTPRYRHSAAVLHGKLYIMGGRDLNDAVVSSTEVYDPSTNLWDVVPFTWTTPRSDNDAFVLGNLIYLVGGYDATYADYATTDILNPETGWTLGSAATTIAPMLVARGDFAIVEHQGRFYAYGGWTSANGFCAPLNEAEVYDPTKDTWTALANLKVARGDKASGVLQGRLYAIGGETTSCDATSNVPLPSTPVMDVEVFDTSDPEGGWVAEGAIPEKKFRFAAATVDETIFVFGGQRPEQFCPHANASCFPISNHTWGLTIKDKKDQGDDEGLSLGGILGIVAACIVLLGLVFYFFYRCGPGTTQSNIDKHIELSGPNQERRMDV